MLRWVGIFLLIAIVAAIFGFGGIAEGATEIAKVIFYIFIGLVVITFLGGLLIYRKIF